MCGITGTWATRGGSSAWDSEARNEALGKIAHRGPDGHGTYLDLDAGVFLGHSRLAIIDLSDAGHQPMASPDGNVVLIFNGEIYNYRELRAELKAEGVHFVGHSDTEVLLHLYLRQGADALPRLNGIFAFAIYDQRCGEMLIARDALGVKPLYVSATGEGVAFSSEIKSLLTLKGDLGPLDLVSIDRYLTYLWCPGEGTPLRDVRKLGPGEAMIVRDGQVARRWTWYELPARRGVRGVMTETEAVRAVRDGLRTAVQRQLVADVPVGAFLSGGLDSSAIVAFAREQVTDLRCFTMRFSGGSDVGETEDLPYARKVASHLGVRLDEVEVDASRMADDLERMVWQLDEPLADPAPLNVLYISQLARQHNIKVLLSGAGGDDLFTGYRRHTAFHYEGLWSWMPRGARRALSATARLGDQRTGVGRRLSRLFAGAEKEGDERIAAYFAWSRRADLVPLYSAGMQEAIAVHRAEQPMLDFLAGVPSSSGRMARMLALEQRFFLADHNLLYTDKMSMAAGVEVRVPFLDLDLVELAAGIPERFKQRGRVGKWVLKKAMEPYLPYEIIHRPKTGFGMPIRRWIRHELRDLLHDILSKESLNRRGLFDPVAVHQLMADNEEGLKDAAFTLLSLLCIEIWCRRYIDAPSTTPHAFSASQATLK